MAQVLVTNSQPIVVSATRLSDTVERSPQSAIVIDKEQIASKSPSRPIDALRDEPGLWLQQTGNGGGTPIIRGMMGNSVLYLVDGIRINNGRLFGGPNAFFNQIDVGAIDRIEILKGPGSVQYGSDAMGGLINVQTPRTDYFSSEPDYGGHLGARYSSADNGLYAHADARFVSSNVNAVAGFTFMNAQNMRTGTGDVLDNTSFKSYGGFAKASGLLCDGNILTVGYLNSTRNDVTRYDQSKVNPNSGDPSSFTPFESRQMIYIKDSIDIRDGWISHLEPYAYWQIYQSDSDNNTERSATVFRRKKTLSEQNMYGTGITAESPIIEEKLKLVYGADFRYEYFQDRIRQLDWGWNNPGTWLEPANIGKTPNGSYDVGDVFMMAEYNPFEDLHLTGGFRFESSHLESNPGYQDATTGNTVDDLDLNRRWNALTYDVGAVYDLTKNLAVTANGSTGYRAPTYSDVLSFGKNTIGVNIPSTSVDSEQCTAGELGLRWKSKDVTANITGFGTYLTDMVTSLPTGGWVDINGDNIYNGTSEDAYTKQNNGTGYIYGLETSGEWRFARRWAVFGNGAWTVGRSNGSDEPLRFIPPLNGVVGIRYEVCSWMNLSAFTRMAACQDEVSATDKKDSARAEDPGYGAPSSTNPARRPDYSIPGWITYNVRAEFQVTDALRIYTGVENITDERYRVAYSRQDSPGVNGVIGADWTF